VPGAQHPTGPDPLSRRPAGQRSASCRARGRLRERRGGSGASDGGIVGSGRPGRAGAAACGCLRADRRRRPSRCACRLGGAAGRLPVHRARRLGSTSPLPGGRGERGGGGGGVWAAPMRVRPPALRVRAAAGRRGGEACSQLAKRASGARELAAAAAAAELRILQAAQPGPVEPGPAGSRTPLGVEPSRQVARVGVVVRLGVILGPAIASVFAAVGPDTGA
jgi:hypothetical protein